MSVQHDPEPALVFNLVWTEGAFEYLGLFTASLLAQSRARFRFVANGCQPDEIGLMERFARAHPGRIEVVVLSTSETLRHGDALDEVWERRDDGAHFCFIDPDILATGPFLQDFLVALGDHAVLTSGRELWSTDNVLPPGHVGLNGEYFFREDGFVYGSPHFAIYDAARLRASLERWGAGFGEGGRGLSDDVRARLERSGHDYLLYDTGKLVNIFLQEDGNTICHREHDNLIHIGGLLHYLWAPRVESDAGAGGEVDWANWKGMTDRHEVARYAAATLREVLAGRRAPDVDHDVSDHLAPRLGLARDAIVGSVARYGEEWLDLVRRAPGPERAASTSYNAMVRRAPRRTGGRSR